MLTSRPKEINKGKIVSNQYYKTQDNVHVVINLHVWVGLERCSLGKWNFSPFPVPVCSSATGAAICGGARWTPVKFPQQLRIRASARAPFYNLFTVLLLSSSTLCWAGNFFTVRRLAGVTVAIFLRSLASYLCNVISGTRPTRFGLREVPDREPIGAVPSLSPKASAFEMSTRSSSRHCFSFSRRDTFANAAHAV